MSLRPAITAALSLTLAACAGLPALAPQAQRLDPQSLDGGSALRAANVDAAWPDQSWWQAYGDPRLDALVRAALAGNPDLRIARARIDQAQGLAAVARGGTLPQVQGDAGFNRVYYTHEELTPTFTQSHTFWDDSMLLKASYDLDLWGKNRSGLDAALDTLHAGQVELRAAQLALASAVVQGYVQLSAQYALRDVAQANLERQRKILDIARRRYKAGLGTQLEVNQATTVLPESEAQIEGIDEALALRRNQLAALLGQGPGAGETIARPALALDRAAPLPASLPAGLIGHRPDIVAQRWRVEAAAKNIEVAKARFYPDIELVALGGLETVSFSQLFTNGALTGGFGPAISLPIFEGGKLRGNLRAQSAGYDIAVESYNSTVIGALREVADQVVSLRSLARQLERTDAALASARTANEQAEQGFRAGLTDYLSVLNTQAELLVQQRSRAQLVARQLQSYAALMQALGGGFEETASARMAQTGRAQP
jgi:NodT family efflux transporter outer membrane factor (OMF) lipoprotein